MQKVSKEKSTPDLCVINNRVNVGDSIFPGTENCDIDRNTVSALVKMLSSLAQNIILEAEEELYAYEQIDYPKKYYLISSLNDVPCNQIHQIHALVEQKEDADFVINQICEKYGNQVTASWNGREIVIVKIYG